MLACRSLRMIVTLLWVHATYPCICSCLLQVGIWPENFQLDQIQNGLLTAIIDFNPLTLFKPSRCIKASFNIPENRPNFHTTKEFQNKNFYEIGLVDHHMVIFFTFSPTSNHLHPLQVKNCDSNLRLVVDEDDNGKFRLERVNMPDIR